MVKKNRLLDRKKVDYTVETKNAVSIMTQNELRSIKSNFNYSSLEISEFDKENLISLEKDIVFQGKILGEVAYKIGKNLENARNILKKYSKSNDESETFVKWYQSLGLNKDQVYLFKGRFNLCLNNPNYKENILSLSDRAIKEVIVKDTPEVVVEKVLVGELTTGKEIKKARDDFKISSMLEKEKEEILEIISNDDNFYKIEEKEKEINIKILEIEEKTLELKKLKKELLNLKQELKKLKI